MVMLYINQQFSREQKSFEKRMKVLQQSIVELNQKSVLQNHKIQLTDELEKTLQTNKSKLGTMIFNLYDELLELLSKNNLLKS